MALNKNHLASQATLANANRSQAHLHHLRVLVQFEFTLKAFANFRPGLRFGNPGKTRPIYRDGNTERVASR